MQVLLQEALSPHILRVTLNRPDAANALSEALASEIVNSFQKLDGYRAVILTGAGLRAFCAGADLKERAGMDEAAWKRQHDTLEAAVHAVMNCPVPVIAAVNGAAYGGGLELALACDFIVASDQARFALTEATLGIMPGLGGSQSLARAIGVRAAKEMLFTGKPIDAKRAQALGLINSIHAIDDLQPFANVLAHTMADNAPLALKAIKQALKEGDCKPLQQAMQDELAHYYALVNSRDRVEGTQAFLEKRKPLFVGQ